MAKSTEQSAPLVGRRKGTILHPGLTSSRTSRRAHRERSSWRATNTKRWSVVGARFFATISIMGLPAISTSGLGKV